MDNKDILILILVICLFYIIYCNNNIDNFYNKISKNIDNFTNENSVTKSIYNFGLLAKIIQNSNSNNEFLNFNINNGNGISLDDNSTAIDIGESGDIKLAGKFNVYGHLVGGIPLKSIILWSQDFPPYPNTNPIIKNGHYLSYTLNSTDCWYPCIGGTINVDGVDINIPDMKGRMMVGYGATNNSSNSRHQFFNNPGSHVGGELPLRSHSHSKASISNGTHHHTIRNNNSGGGCTGGNCGNVNSGLLGYNKSFDTGQTDLKTSTESGHTHLINLSEKSYNHGTDAYSIHVIPHAIIIQYWIRIR